jgi:uncharacterized membrane protein
MGIGKGRMEALADGVFAIAMTLLILDVKVPVLAPEEVGALPGKLAELWPRFIAYAVSFLIIGVFWVGHHALLHYIRGADRLFLWINIIFLMVIAALPFSTGLMGSYPGQPTAVMVYCGHLIVAGVALCGQLRYAAGPGKLFDPDTDPQLIVHGGRRILMGPGIYLIALGFAFVDTRVSLILCLVTPLLYLFPGRVDRYWRHGHPREEKSTG